MERTLNLAIIGYGKMGREIEKQAKTQGYNVVCVVDNDNDWKAFPNKADVALEFTTPESAVGNIFRCFEAGLPVVCGTTGWHNRLAEVSMICLSKNQTLFYASNFSLGVNIFFELNRKLASLLSNFGQYNPFISEIHHIHKLDAPSGTAIVLANDIIDENQRFNVWKPKEERTIESEIPIESLRINQVPGTHVVSWKSIADTIEIKHSAHNRSGFVQGALMAACWVAGKKGLFTMKDLLNL